VVSVEFRYTSFAQEVVFGPGRLDSLPDAVAQFGWRRVLLCVTRSARASGLAARVEAALAERRAATYEPVRQHVADFQVAEAIQLAEECRADAVLGLGGGSPIGLAKAVSLVLEERRTGRAARAEYPTEQPLAPVIAIPTTYAGSELTAVYGITHTDGETPRKVTVSDPKIAPKLIVYDPDLTLDLPPEITAASGINALAHCVEAIYSQRRNPNSTAAALAGIRHIVSALPRCWARGADREARAEMMLGAHLAAAALSHVSMALHHGLCHVLGGTAGAPHGIANAIVLPHAMRFNIPAAAPELAQAADAMGIARNGRGDGALAAAGADAVAAMIGGMNLPQRLSQVGVARADLPALAELAMHSRAVQSNPRAVKEASEIEALLLEML